RSYYLHRGRENTLPGRKSSGHPALASKHRCRDSSGGQAMIRAIRNIGIGAALLQVTAVASATEIDLKYYPPGELFVWPRRNDRTIYFPDVIFPLAVGPTAGNAQAFANSQINGPTPFQYPWHDTYCEKREWTMPLCPTGKGHQGVDISPSTKENVKWQAVAM